MPAAQPFNRYACLRQFAQLLLAPLPRFQITLGLLQFVSISRSAYQGRRHTPVSDFTARQVSGRPLLLCASQPFDIRFCARAIVERSADAGRSIARHPEQILAFTSHCRKTAIFEQHQNASHRSYE
jgi:hypothetical protein